MAGRRQRDTATTAMAMPAAASVTSPPTAVGGGHGPQARGQRIERGGHRDRETTEATTVPRRRRPQDHEAEGDDDEQAPPEAGRLGEPLGDDGMRAGSGVAAVRSRLLRSGRRSAGSPQDAPDPRRGRAAEPRAGATRARPGPSRASVERRGQVPMGHHARGEAATARHGGSGPMEAP